ncbi:MAG TPA: outer membrane protein transport protein [Polyangiaceae bacterium]|nr:outer membrane protein transport protein [Polyangiaceae bacterium]
MRVSFDRRRWPLSLGVGLALLLGSSAASAAGFDTPILYTARHQGMGGAAIAYVDDPSAAFHNPAGLQGVRGLAFLGDATVLLAHVTGSPASTASASGIQSQLIVAPLFLAGAAYRIQSWLTAGIAVFPAASGGAEYEYAVPDSEIYQTNSTTIVFYEATPLISLNVPEDMLLPGRLSFGFGYRATLATFEREQGERENPRALNLDLSGNDFKGFRAGMQYRAGKWFSIGAVYRNKIEVNTRADDATVLGMPATHVELPFILPAQFGAGIRSDYDRLGVAFDAVYSFQSQNERTVLSGTVAGMPAAIPNVFDWRDAFTLRFGFEFRLGPSEELPIRVGYVYDETVSSRAYPSAFATPPSPTRTFTLGGGYDTGTWELNLALALRSGSTEVDPEEIAPPQTCPTCGFSGEYAITTTGLYLDFSTDIEL